VARNALLEFSNNLFNTLGTGPRIYTWENLCTGYRATHIYIYIRYKQKSGFYGPGIQNNVLFFWLKYFLETRLSSESLDPLIDFLAYLEPKLWPTNKKLDINSNPTKGNLGHFG